MKAFLGGSLLALMGLVACGRTVRDYGDPVGSGGGGGGGGGGGQAGSSGIDECSRAADCPAPDDECIGAACEAGTCLTVNLEAGSACSAGVCSGSGVCADCVPAATECDGDTPLLCSEAGAWVEQPACGLGSKCRDGRCRGLDVDWYLQADSDAWVEMQGVGVDDAGRVYLGGYYFRNFEFGGHSHEQDEPHTNRAFLAQVPADGGEATYVHLPDASATNLLSVAPNGNQYLVADLAAKVASYTSAGSERYYREFYAPESTAGASVGQLNLVPTPNGNGAFLLFKFQEEVRWSYPATPGYQAEAQSGCNTFLTELNGGDPTWTTSYPWCTTQPQKLALGTNGNLYIASGTGNNADYSEPPTIGGRSFESDQSIALLEVDPSDGTILDTREFPSTGYSGVLAMVPLSTGHIVLAIRPGGDLTLGDAELPQSALYLVKTDLELNPVAHVALGEGQLTGFGEPTLWMAAGPNDEIYVAGGIQSDFDFGAGLHEYQGTSTGGRLGDAFIASYDSDLQLLFSQTYGSPVNDRIHGVAADANHLYVVLYFGDTLDLHGTVLNPGLEGASSVLVKFSLK